MNRLKETAAPVPDESPMERIVNRVGHAFGVRPRDMLGSGRQRQVMVPRHVAMYLSRLVAKVPLTRIVYVEESDFREADAKDYYGLAEGKTAMLK